MPLQPRGLTAHPNRPLLRTRGGFIFRLLEDPPVTRALSGCFGSPLSIVLPSHFLAGELSQEAHCPSERERAENKEAIDWRESRQAAFLDLCQGQGP